MTVTIRKIMKPALDAHLSRRSVVKAGVASAGLLAAARLGDGVSAQDATPAANGFTTADYQPSAAVEIEYWLYALDA